MQERYDITKWFKLKSKSSVTTNINEQFPKTYKIKQ